MLVRYVPNPFLGCQTASSLKANRRTDPARSRLVFANEEVGIFNCSHLLNFGVFQELKDPSYFRQAKIENGTVSWPHEQDICPDTLYEEAYKEKPFQNTKMHVTDISI